MNTKGISPLIATIFLIAVAVALGSIVMSLGQEYVSQADIGGGVGVSICDAVSYDIKSIRLVQLQNRFEFVMDNNDIRIDGFLFKFFSSDFSEAYTDRVTQEVSPYDVGIVKINVDNRQISDVGSLTVVPLRRSGSEYQPCDENAKEFNSDEFTLV